jgi:hypothetical protein
MRRELTHAEQARGRVVRKRAKDIKIGDEVLRGELFGNYVYPVEAVLHERNRFDRPVITLVCESGRGYSRHFSWNPRYLVDTWVGGSTREEGS